MLDKKINEIIIISDYDGSFGLSVWYKGQPHTTDPTALKIRGLFHSYKPEKSINDIMLRFQTDVLLCCDGDIEYFECPIDNRSLL